VESLSVTSLAALYDELALAGQAPSVEAFVAAHPEQPGLRQRLLELERLRKGLARLLGEEPAQVTLDDGTPPAIPGFRMLRCLAEGGMGRVWVAEQEHPRRLCAIKVLLVGTKQAEERFRREADLAARLSHPGIARVYAFAEAAGRPYLVTEYVPGFPLRSLLRVADLVAPSDPATWLCEALRGLYEGPAPESKATLRAPVATSVRLALEVALALAHAHERGVVHRDVKPANIMIGLDGHVRLIDFGIALPLVGLDERLTQSGAFVGSLAYAAPEQLRGESERVGPWTDTFSLGATLFEMLTQAQPFVAADFAGRLALADAALVNGPRALNPDVPRDLDALVRRALSPDPAARFADGDELARALAGLGRGRFGWALSVAGFGRRTLGRWRGSLFALAALVAVVTMAGLYLRERTLRFDEAARHARALQQSDAQLLGLAAEKARTALDACVTYRPVPLRSPMLVARVRVHQGAVRDVEVLGSSSDLTRPARACLAAALSRLELPGVGVEEPIELELRYRVDLGEP